MIEISGDFAAGGRRWPDFGIILVLLVANAFRLDFGRTCWRATPLPL